MKFFHLLLLLFALTSTPLFGQEEHLFTPASSFSDEDHIVSASFFHWFASTGGQLSGPWEPLEGRENWTGLTPWWKTQIKQVMMANIDVLNVHLINSTEIHRELFFEAMYEMRAEGYDVPKVCPFLDPLITWYQQPLVDLATTAGKDEFVDQYIRFYEQYFDRNPDEYAGDYLAKIDGKLMLDTWHLFLNLDNVDQFSREDLTTRLEAAFPDRPEFSSDIYMITPALNNPTFSFTDERTPQFEINEYYYENIFNGRKTVQLKAGYWDQNIRTPGDFVPRDGGIHFEDAWDQVDETVDRVYIESWNEYDEGTGIYAGDVGPPYLINDNPNTDVWSDTDDPFEYICTTKEGAAAFNDRPELDALFLTHDFPATLMAGATQIVQVTVRNEGDLSWSNAEGVSLQLIDNDPALTYEGGMIDDDTNEIPFYGGIFRGRPITLEIEVTAPDMLGFITTNWQMVHNGEPFGDTLTVDIEIVEPSGVINSDLHSIDLTVSPNPSTRDIRIDWNGAPADQILLFDQIGQQLATFSNVSSGEVLSINTESGVYFLMLEIDGYRFVQKIIRW